MSKLSTPLRQLMAALGVTYTPSARHFNTPNYPTSRGATPNHKGRVALYNATGDLLGHGDLAKWQHLPVAEVAS